VPSRGEEDGIKEGFLEEKLGKMMNLKWIIVRK
jgi:hypothetical protein